MDTGTGVEVHPSNQDQLRNWDGHEGGWWAENAATYDRILGGYHAALLDAARIAPTDRVLDVGCGCGQVTRDAARIAAGGSALGVDISSPMLEMARRLAAAEGLDNARFLRADAQVHPFDAAGFDAVLSRFGVLFFGDPVAAFANLARALRPGGRLAVLGWQVIERNEWFREVRAAIAAGRDLPLPRPGGQGPFALCEPNHVHDVLGRAGFTGVDLHPVSAPLRYGDGVDSAYRFLSGSTARMVEELGEEDREHVRAALRASVEQHLTPRGVEYGGTAWLITAQRA